MRSKDSHFDASASVVRSWSRLVAECALIPRMLSRPSRARCASARLNGYTCLRNRNDLCVTLSTNRYHICLSLFWWFDPIVTIWNVLVGRKPIKPRWMGPVVSVVVNSILLSPAATLVVVSAFLCLAFVRIYFYSHLLARIWIYFACRWLCISLLLLLLSCFIITFLFLFLNWRDSPNTTAVKVMTFLNEAPSEIRRRVWG